jgi:death-on-curing protein
MRLFAANHPFVDGNKRTALASTIHFYFWNRYDLDYQEELEAMLILIAIREDFIDADVAVEYLETIVEESEIRDALERGLERLEEFAEHMERSLEEDDDVSDGWSGMCSSLDS